MIDEISLTPVQHAAIATIIDWLESPGKQIFRLGGFAGVGKTTLLKYLLRHIRQQYAVTSFTGKAVSVLKRKGINDARTMHSYLYDPNVEKDGTVTWVKKIQFDEELVIVDEASMVSNELNDDLLSTGAKILYVGDPGQLEPVGNNPNLMKDCDVVLTQIHRQAADSPILRLATEVRGGATPKHGREQNEASELLITDKTTALQLGAEVEQVICGYNATRIQVNQIMRKHYDRKGLLVPNEKLICLKNNRKEGLFNGMMLYVKTILADWDDCFLCNLVDDLGRTFVQIKVNKHCLSQGEWNDKKDGRVPFGHNLFTYGYCITCHKSQGSEWESVVVLDQAASKYWTAERWRYTAITRASKRLIYGI